MSAKVAVKAFGTIHRVAASLGYVAYEIRKKLKQEYVIRNPTGADLAALRRQGVCIEDEHWAPVVAYTGDTAIDFFHMDTSRDFLCASVLVTEVRENRIVHSTNRKSISSVGIYQYPSRQHIYVCTCDFVRRCIIF